MQDTYAPAATRLIIETVKRLNGAKLHNGASLTKRKREIKPGGRYGRSTQSFVG